VYTVINFSWQLSDTHDFQFGHAVVSEHYRFCKLVGLIRVDQLPFLALASSLFFAQKSHQKYILLIVQVCKLG